jgi:hypothetical protein
MEARTQTTDFFKAGGTLHPNAPSYIKRPADDELYQQLLVGQFCYLLTSRQRGKSSLMIRTAERLRQANFKTAIVDLSGIGTQVSREQWYLGIIKRLVVELGLSVDSERWWHAHQALSQVQRFIDFLHDVVLAKIGQRIVIFVDEIDTTLKLNFTDDFFAAIRSVYNLRASDPAYDRLTFVLLGVAAPADLIKDRNRTPFNIGYALDLQELSRDDARPFQDDLEQLYPGRGPGILDRVFYWTNGHPYLTQKICSEIAARSDSNWPDHQVDALVKQLFLTEDARKESNLHFVRSNIEASPARRQLLRLYQRVYEGRMVAEDERAALQKRLELSGLIRVEDGMLRVRNEIYRRVFDQAWIKANTPINWIQIASVTAVLFALLALVAAIVLILQQRAQTQVDQANFAIEQLRQSDDPDVQMSYLSVICSLAEDDQAQHIFIDWPPEKQQALFEQLHARDAGESLLTVVRCLSPAVEALPQIERRAAIAKAMSCALAHSGLADSKSLRERTGYIGACPEEWYGK